MIPIVSCEVAHDPLFVTSVTASGVASYTNYRNDKSPLNLFNTKIIVVEWGNSTFLASIGYHLMRIN